MRIGKCSLCKFSTFVCSGKSKQRIYTICSNSECKDVVLYVEKTNTFIVNQKQKCESCEKFVLKIKFAKTSEISPNETVENLCIKCGNENIKFSPKTIPYEKKKFKNKFKKFSKGKKFKK
jgi:RNA-binding protein YhbY